MNLDSDYIARGEKSRLFPILSETSKEGRSLSIFLACLACVNEFGAALLADIGQRIGKRTSIATYTEVVLRKGGEKLRRPDGLITLSTGSRKWTALVEAKVGSTELSSEQLEDYIEIAKLNQIDALITISNQFAALPTHHPIALSASTRKKVDIYHWSWMYVVTQASLLLSDDSINDRDQKIILKEMVRFLTHPSAGVKNFDQMPAVWADVVKKIQLGGAISPSSDEAREVVGAWHQELRDLTLILSRQLGADVALQISRAHSSDPVARQKAGVTELVDKLCLTAVVIVPDAASPIEICVDLQKRSVSVSMKLRAPTDRKSTKARVNWLLRQLPEDCGTDVHVRLLWPGRAAHTQYPIKNLRDDPALSSNERENLVVLSFQIVLIRDLGGRFGQRKNFIKELEAAVPDFYESAGQHLKPWQARPPKLAEDKTGPETVNPEAIYEEVEKSAT